MRDWLWHTDGLFRLDDQSVSPCEVTFELRLGDLRKPGRDLAEELLGRGTSRVFHTLNISYVPYGITFWDLSLNHWSGSLPCSHLSFCTFWQSARVSMCLLYYIWSKNGVWPMGFAWVTRTPDRISMAPSRSDREQLLGELAQMPWTLF